MKTSLFFSIVLFLFVQVSLGYTGDTIPVYPPNHATNMPTTVTLKWHKQNLPVSAFGYRVIISTAKFAWNIPIDSSKTNFYHPGRDTFITVTLKQFTGYYWKIQAVDILPVWSFSTGASTSVLPSVSRISIPAKSSNKYYNLQGRIISKPTSNHLHILLKH
jgi:hypothetical protein